MKLKQGQIDIFFEEGGLKIRLRDGLAGTTFAEVHLNQKQTLQALSRLSHTHCDIEVRGLENVGKRMVHKSLEFPISKDSIYGPERQAVAIKRMEEAMPDGWSTDGYFGSQESFFERDGERWARITIRKWVDIDESE